MMGTGNDYGVVDMSRSVGGVDFTEFAIQKMYPEIPDLNSTHYRVIVNSNPSLGESVDIYVDGFRAEKDNLINALRAYQAVLDFQQ